MGPLGPGGFRRRGRRRGLVVGAAIGAAGARNRAQSSQTQSDTNPETSLSAELTELDQAKSQGLINQSEYDAKRKQILGL